MGNVGAGAGESAFGDNAAQLVERLTRERDAAVTSATTAQARQRRLVEAIDKLRVQFSRELHDGAQQQLVNTLLYLRRSEQHWADPPEAARQLLDLAMGEVQSGIDGLRSLTARMYPAILTTRGLDPALDALATRLPCHVDLQLVPDRFAAEIESCTYFVCAEALSNVVTHAKVDRASVTMTAQANRLTVEVRDEGIGGAAIRPGGGLAGLADRVAAFGGTFGVDSPPGFGTTLTARFDLHTTA